MVMCYVHWPFSVPVFDIRPDIRQSNPVSGRISCTGTSLANVALNNTLVQLLAIGTRYRYSTCIQSSE
jgi:hypothetical protein